MPINIHKPENGTPKAEAALKGKYEDHLTDTSADLKATSMKATVETEHTSGKNVTAHSAEEQEMPGPIVPVDKLAHVMVHGGRTVNLGNYEAVKFGVSLTVPCPIDDIGDAYEHALNWVSEKIAELVEATQA